MGKNKNKKNVPPMDPAEEIRQIFAKAIQKSFDALANGHYEYEYDWALTEDLYNRVSRAVMVEVNSEVDFLEIGKEPECTCDDEVVEITNCGYDDCEGCNENPELSLDEQLYGSAVPTGEDPFIFEATVTSPDQLSGTVRGLFQKLFAALDEAEQRDKEANRIASDTDYLNDFMGDAWKKEVDESVSQSFTPESQQDAAYWRQRARQWENRSKANLKNLRATQDTLDKANELLRGVKLTKEQDRYGTVSYWVHLPGLNGKLSVSRNDVEKAMLRGVVNDNWV